MKENLSGIPFLLFFRISGQIQFRVESFHRNRKSIPGIYFHRRNIVFVGGCSRFLCRSGIDQQVARTGHGQQCRHLPVFDREPCFLDVKKRGGTFRADNIFTVPDHVSRDRGHSVGCQILLGLSHRCRSRHFIVPLFRTYMHGRKGQQEQNP